MTQILNAGIHANLIAQGFVHSHQEADWYDDGGPESGPHLAGHAAYDMYEDHDLRIYVTEAGTVDGFEFYDAAFEAAMEAEQEAYWADLSAKTGKSVKQLEDEMVASMMAMEPEVSPETFDMETRYAD